MTPNVISLREHELRSLRKWLNGMGFTHPTDLQGQKIYIERPAEQVSRPAMKIEEIPGGRGISMGRLLVRRRVQYQISVMATSKWEAERQVDDILERVLRSELVPLYLWGWAYLTPGVGRVAGGGSLDAGQVSVRVSAVNASGHESLASAAVETEVEDGDALRLAITPWPRSAPVAKEYRVYAGALGAEKLEATVSPVLTGGGIPTVATLTDLTGTGIPLSSNSSVFFYRFMRVAEPVESVVLEHPDMEGPHDGNVTLTLEYMTARIPYAEQAEAMAQIGVDFSG
jgi:hypothetical protein